MKVSVKRICVYSLLLVCGFYLLQVLYPETIMTGKKIKDNHSWEDKRVLFGTGLLSPEVMRTICFNKTLLPNRTDYPLLQHNPIHRIQPTFYYSNKFNMLVCSVPKAGSTFWTTTMGVITGVDAEYKDNMPPRKSIHAVLDSKMKVDYEDMKKTFDGYKVITARNPYSRLFSTYIDKVFLPTNWKLSSNIRDKVKGRFGFDEPQNFCLNDLTFSDFLLYVTTNYNVYSNVHWMPIINLCEPCETSRVIIIHEENFVSDVKQALKIVGILPPRIATLTSILESNSTQQTLSIVQTLLYTSFLNKNHYCLSSTEILKRIWTSLQIQGRILESKVFPEKMFSENMSLKTLKSAFKNAVKLTVSSQMMTPERRNKQRNTALISVYKTVHPGIIQSIRKIYYSEFAVFNYSMHVPTGQTLQSQPLWVMSHESKTRT